MIRKTSVVVNTELDYLKMLSSDSAWIKVLSEDYGEKLDLDAKIAFKNLLKDDYLDRTVLDFLICEVGVKCGKLEVEYPYYDNDYLSVFYNHYSKKFLGYEKKCVRIHFFNRCKEYCGFIILRPILGGSKIGRSCLSPQLFGNTPKYILKTNFAVHICGEKRKIEAFPWKHQETDVAVCAHVAIWNLLKYYGNKYINYRDTRIGEIVDVVEETEGRKTPTKGLTPIQTSNILKTYGFSPVIVNQNKDSFNDFKEELVAYVESGLPIIAFLNYKGEHAVTIMGHGDVDYNLIDSSTENTKQSNAVGIEELVVMDDNYSPYRMMPMSMATKESEVPYCATHIEYYVVPLYDRVQLEYKIIKTRLNDWLKLKVMDWERKDVYRIYLTSSKSLKERTREDKMMDKDIKDVILRMSMPRFIWCIDFSTREEYRNQLCSGRIIIDSTSENYYSEPWIFRHDDVSYQYKDYDETSFRQVTKKRKASNPYAIYKNNLKEIR